MRKSLSEDLRWRIIYCQAEGFTQKEIAKRMYVSEATVSKVCRLFKKWGCVKDPFVGKVGRRKIFTRQDMLVRIIIFICILIIIYLIKIIIYRYWKV
jgi:transposase